MGGNLLPAVVVVFCMTSLFIVPLLAGAAVGAWDALKPRPKPVRQVGRPAPQVTHLRMVSIRGIR